MAAVAAGLSAFFAFFTCFLAGVVVVEWVSVGAGAVCAASDKPAVASESPKSTAKIFFIVLFVLCSECFSRPCIFASVCVDEVSINPA